MHSKHLLVFFAVIIAFLFCSCDNGTELPSSGNTAEAPVVHSFTVREVFPERNGMKIYGKLYVPDDTGEKLPAVVLSHSADLNADSMTSYAEGFAERGYIACAFDFCGSGKKSRSDGSTDDMTVFTEMDDLKTVISFVSALGSVDKERIYLFGTSLGGLVSALTAEECTDIIKGEILLYPAFSIPDIVRKFSEFGISRYSKGFSETLMDYDAYDHIGTFPGKVLIIHGSKDFFVSPSCSERAKEKYTDCELRIIEGAGHGFNRENYSSSGDYDGKVWSFIEEYLLNHDTQNT
ncbi:MAG: alpha/beta hydrolase family protein [Bullifex sp.]